jgi:hypothetical protein
MMGCLTAPFKLIGCLGLLIVLGLAYLYRDRLEHEGRRLIERVQGIVPSTSGRPGVSALESAKAKVDSLNGWRADSVVLTPSEFASLVGSGMDRDLRSQLDSLQVELMEGEIRVSARLHTDRLSPELTGPLGGALRPTEPVHASGPVRVTRPGAGEWRVRTFRIGDFPVPDEMVPGLVGHALGDPGRTAVPVQVPRGVRAIRVRPGGATLYGASRS